MYAGVALYAQATQAIAWGHHQVGATNEVPPNLPMPYIHSSKLGLAPPPLSIYSN